MKQFCYFFYMFLFLSGQVFGQVDSLCKGEIIFYLERMASVKAPEDNKTYFIDYSTISKYSEKSGNPDKEIRFKLYYSNDLLVLDSDMLTMYSDTVESFIILHEQKAIIIGSGNKSTEAPNKAQDVFNQQLESLNNCTLVGCEVQKINNSNYRYTKYIVNEDLAKQLNVVSLKVWFDMDKKCIYKVESKMDPSAYPIDRQIIVYNIIDFNNSATIKGTARERVMKSKTELLPKYKGYSFINQ